MTSSSGLFAGFRIHLTTVAFLAIAATNVRGVNRQIFEEAERQNVLLNVVDDAPLCTFIAPSIVERGPVTLAISTAGASPALARKLRESLTNDPVLDWADLAGVMSQVRSELKKQGAVVDPQRWQCCLSSQLLDLARSGAEEEHAPRPRQVDAAATVRMRSRTSPPFTAPSPRPPALPPRTGSAPG